MYSVELQALSQLVSAPKLASDSALAEDFRQHEVETREHARLMGERLEAHGESSSAIQNAIMKLGGKGFLLFAAVMPETPGRLTAHSYSYESMEWAGYEMLIRFAEAAGDGETVAAAKSIREQERTMMGRLESRFDNAEAASHRDKTGGMLGDIQMHLNEAHALEAQGIALLSKSDDIAGSGPLAEACRANLADTREHAAALERRLDALGASTSKLKDAVLGAGGLNWGFFFQGQSDTPAKLAAFAYAFEHLKIAGYELLLRSAKRAGDTGTIELAEMLIASERAMAERVLGTFDSAVQATLQQVG